MKRTDPTAASATLTTEERGLLLPRHNRLAMQRQTAELAEEPLAVAAGPLESVAAPDGLKPQTRIDSAPSSPHAEQLVQENATAEFELDLLGDSYDRFVAVPRQTRNTNVHIVWLHRTIVPEHDQGSSRPDPNRAKTHTERSS